MEKKKEPSAKKELFRAECIQPPTGKHHSLFSQVQHNKLHDSSVECEQQVCSYFHNIFSSGREVSLSPF